MLSAHRFLVFHTVAAVTATDIPVTAVPVTADPLLVAPWHWVLLGGNGGPERRTTCLYGGLRSGLLHPSPPDVVEHA
jgi:hypothetical protein